MDCGEGSRQPEEQRRAVRRGTGGYGSRLLSCRVQLESYVYPPYGTPLVEAYGAGFESVFIVLHPFVRVPEPLAWSVTRQYPDDAQIHARGSRCSWAEVAAQAGMTSCARVNQALLTSIGSLTDYLADPSGRDALQTLVQTQPVWLPAEGRFEPLLQASFLEAFAMAGHEQLVFVPEFPQSDPVERLAIAALRSGAVPFPFCGTLMAPDESFLFTVDWDSFFTLFYGPRAFVANAARTLALEGFFATPNTDHAWFNYTMGCATVTVSPEDWPNVEAPALARGLERMKDLSQSR